MILLPIHIVGGGLAIVFGAVALTAAKGGWLHRKSGMVFVYAMLTMGISASILALNTGNVGNFLGGFTCAYFVVTALTTVRPATAWTTRLTIGAAALALTLASIDFTLGIKAMASPRFMLNGVPGPMLFFLGTVIGLGGTGDIRVLRNGPPRGAMRLRRHLWRMCFALFIAAGSFFSIRARVARILPEPFLSAPMRMVPILLPFAAIVYWKWKLRGRARLAEA